MFARSPPVVKLEALATVSLLSGVPGSTPFPTAQMAKGGQVFLPPF